MGRAIGATVYVTAVATLAMAELVSVLCPSYLPLCS